jgi:hypothetical protein
MYTIYFYEKRGGDMHPKLHDTINYVDIHDALREVNIWLDLHPGNAALWRKVKNV